MLSIAVDCYLDDRRKSENSSLLRAVAIDSPRSPWVADLIEKIESCSLIMG